MGVLRRAVATGEESRDEQRSQEYSQTLHEENILEDGMSAGLTTRTGRIQDNKATGQRSRCRSIKLDGSRDSP
jgi:hypothetical protein